METTGATRTGLGSLEHELGHMYFGVTAVNRTWRDTWFDESAVVWWEEHASLDPVGPRFRSAIGAGHPAAAPGFRRVGVRRRSQGSRGGREGDGR